MCPRGFVSAENTSSKLTQLQGPPARTAGAVHICRILRKKHPFHRPSAPANIFGGEPLRAPPAKTGTLRGAASSSSGRLHCPAIPSACGRTRARLSPRCLDGRSAFFLCLRIIDSAQCFLSILIWKLFLRRRHFLSQKRLGPYLALPVESLYPGILHEGLKRSVDGQHLSQTQIVV